ncbi:hypothetical protein EV424DRAFT_1349650 [Suillus variegatus]|nr:hypothetical protein EV424DRAFT_1349650 [Suillus variegatus]
MLLTVSKKLGSECSKDLEACAEAKREKAQVKLGENVPKRGHVEPKRYRVGSLVDSGWMHLDGWRHRVCKRGNACACIYIAKRGNGIAADSTQSGAASWCCILPSGNCHITL